MYTVLWLDEIPAFPVSISVLEKNEITDVDAGNTLWVFYFFFFFSVNRFRAFLVIFMRILVMYWRFTFSRYHLDKIVLVEQDSPKTLHEIRHELKIKRSVDVLFTMYV